MFRASETAVPEDESGLPLGYCDGRGTVVRCERRPVVWNGKRRRYRPDV